MFDVHEKALPPNMIQVFKTHISFGLTAVLNTFWNYLCLPNISVLQLWLNILTEHKRKHNF